MIEFQNVTFTYQSTERESGVYHLKKKNTVSKTNIRPHETKP